MPKRLVIIVLLLSFLIPATVFASGDGDIPESLVGMCTANGVPTDFAFDGDWDLYLITIWNMLVEAISLLP